MNIPLPYYVIALILFLFFLRNTKKMAVSILVVYMFLLLCTTVLARKPSENINVELYPFWYFKIESSGLRRDLLKQVFANIVMFIPVGMLMYPYIKKYAVLVGVLFSCAIELLQLSLHRGWFEVDDIISNTIGVLFGIFIYRLLLIVRDKAMDYKRGL